MNHNLHQFLIELLKTPSPSGFEEKIQLLFINFIRDYVDELKVDIQGNVIAHKKGNGAQRIMLMSHADEVGLMVKYIDDNGFIYFSEVGGVDPNILEGIQVEIHNKKQTVQGIIGKRTSSEDGDKRNLNVEDLWVDIGVKSKKEALDFIKIGDFITFRSNVNILPNKRISSKSLDNKIGLYIIASVLEQLSGVPLDCDLYIVSSVQEEIGLRGAMTATFDINPDIGIAIDVTHATDYPTNSSEKNGDIKLNEGVVIPIGANINTKVNEIFMRIIEENGIKYQLEAIPHATRTDANVIQITRSGVATGLLSIPCRYMHSPNEIIALEDAASAIELLTLFCKSISNGISFVPYQV